MVDGDIGIARILTAERGKEGEVICEGFGGVCATVREGGGGAKCGRRVTEGWG